MNIEKIDKLIEIIKKQPHVSVNAESGFNMIKEFHPCGAPSCILGFLFQMEGLEKKDFNTTKNAIKRSCKILKISQQEAEELFYPDTFYSEKISFSHLNYITPDDAVLALENLKYEEQIWKHAIS